MNVDRQISALCSEIESLLFEVNGCRFERYEKRVESVFLQLRRISASLHSNIDTRSHLRSLLVRQYSGKSIEGNLIAILEKNDHHLDKRILDLNTLEIALDQLWRTYFKRKADAAIALGDDQTALDIIRQALFMDPFNKDMHRRLIDLAGIDERGAK